MLQKLNKTINYFKKINLPVPKAGIVLGTGLGGLIDDIDVSHAIPYDLIPNFPVSTVQGHAGKLIFGYIGDIPIVAMQGRFHYYEGYSMQEVTYPIRLMKLLGIEALLISNASGGMNKKFSIGDLMIIKDHINLQPDNPLRGENIEDFGPRFPDMSQPYDLELVKKAEKIAKKNKIKIHKGVYASVSGPNFESPAEYKFLSIIGADAVGMSTVPEVIVARHMGLPVFAISVITDLGIDGKIVEVSHEEVERAAMKAEPKLTTIMKQLIKNL